MNGDVKLREINIKEIEGILFPCYSVHTTTQPVHNCAHYNMHKIFAKCMDLTRRSHMQSCLICVCNDCVYIRTE